MTVSDFINKARDAGARYIFVERYADISGIKHSPSPPVFAWRAFDATMEEMMFFLPDIASFYTFGSCPRIWHEDCTKNLRLKQRLED